MDSSKSERCRGERRPPRPVKCDAPALRSELGALRSRAGAHCPQRGCCECFADPAPSSTRAAPAEAPAPVGFRVLLHGHSSEHHVNAAGGNGSGPDRLCVVEPGNAEHLPNDRITALAPTRIQQWRLRPDGRAPPHPGGQPRRTRRGRRHCGRIGPDEARDRRLVACRPERPAGKGRGAVLSFRQFSVFGVGASCRPTAVGLDAQPNRRRLNPCVRARLATRSLPDAAFAS